MLNLNRDIRSYIAALLCIICAYGCEPQKEFTYELSMKSKSFYRAIPAIAASKKLGDHTRNFGAVEHVSVYRAVFKERYVVSDNVMDYAMINDSSDMRGVDFKKVSGYRQEVFLLLLDSNLAKGSIPVVYFSAKYNPGDTCIGFGPSYFGYMNLRTDRGGNEYRKLDFIMELKTGKDSGYYLKKRGKTDITFVADEMVKPARLYIKTVAYSVSNKVAGNKSLIFPVKEILGDSTALRFDHIETISLK